MDEKIFELFQKLSDQLRETTDALKQIIANHETRIVVLEQKKSEDWKTQLLMLLAKALLIGAVSIGSLVGAGNLLKNVLSTPTLTTQSTTF